MSTPEMHRRHVLAAAAAAVVLLLAVGGFFLSSWLEDSEYREQRSDMSDDFGRLPTLTYQGETWRMRTGLTSILLIGYDKRDGDPDFGFTNGGQSDFMLLLVIDAHNRQVHQLQLDRDTMGPVQVLSTVGKPLGAHRLQLALAHAYGRRLDQNDANTRDAVQNFLKGSVIDFSVSMNMSAIPRLNHLLGGVTVTLEDDFSDFDPAMTPGARLKLTDRQAEIFIHERMEIGDGTNVSRMGRHRAYLNAASAALRSRVRSDKSYANTFVTGAEELIYTEMSRGRMVNELNAAAAYDLLPVEVLEGVHSVGARDFMECDVSEDTVMQWVLRTYYEKI